MLSISTKLLSLLALLLFLTGGAKAVQEWPLKGDIDLSSGFGDYRDGHFHFGLDLRTGGKIGKQVFAPESGYVWRVRTSYEGYGKALYIRCDDGYTYVFGHLSQFSAPVDRELKAAQIESEKYYQDLYFPEDSLPVKKGELIAFTGKTGSGAPHLHFEKRQDDTPLNPLKSGFKVHDKIGPTFTRLGVALVDDRSLLPNGERKLQVDVVRTGKEDHYFVDMPFYLNRPFGLFVECFDRGRPGGMKHSVYKLSLYIDDDLHYQVKFDSVDFKTNHTVSLEYDYLAAVDKRKHVRSLYKKTGNVFAGGRGKGTSEGRFGLEGSERYGLHEGRIVAEDASGNQSELKFRFLWGPHEHIYDLDSTVSVAKDTTLFYLSPIAGFEAFSIDSAIALLNRGKAWGQSPDVEMIEIGDGKLICKVRGFKFARAVLRMFLYTSSGVIIQDNLFNGLRKHGSKKLRIKHEIIEDGLLVTLGIINAKGADSRIDLYWRDSLLGTEYPNYIDMTKHACLIPPIKQYARIDRIEAATSHDSAYFMIPSDSLNIVVLGLEPEEEVAINKLFHLRAGVDYFYKPTFVELKWTPVLNKTAMRVSSDHYQILPKAFVCRKDFEISYRIPRKGKTNQQSGLCWLDEQEDRWVWLDNVLEGTTLSAASRGGGSFVSVIDYDPPTIKRLSLMDGGKYHDVRPPVSFFIEDTLSGIGDDSDIRIEIDGQWLIPEYDPESGRCSARPLEPLEPGRHHFGLMVTDRAGNLFEKYFNFYIKKSGRSHGK
ncbi:MAG: M23 family metallopeptidase [candidate division Zixibacteria bacterium]|nr:M23 family metallopeptidase [candidate division Zixibacteria bacterium]